MSFSVFTKFKAIDGVTPAFKSMIQKGNSFQAQAEKIQNAFARTFRSVGSGIRTLKGGISSVTDKIFTIKNAIMAVAAGQVVSKITTLGKAWIDMASDLVETQGKIEVVFGSMEKKVTHWAKSSVKNMGLAQQTALDSAALFGDMGTGMGMSQKRAAEMAMSLTQLGADLASFKNISSDMSTVALKSIYTGETETLKNLGVVMTQANLEEFARSKGFRKKIKDMREAEKVELRYLYVLDRTKNAQGDFLRTGGNAANQMRMHSEMLKEIQTNWGMVILPEYTKFLTSANQLLIDNMPVIQKTFEDFYSVLKRCYHMVKDVYGAFKSFFDFVNSNSDKIIAALSGIATVALIANFNNLTWAILGLAIKMGTLTASIWASVTAIAAQTAALLTNPFTWVAIAIGLVVAGLVLMIIHWDKVKAAIIGFVRNAKAWILELWQKIEPVFTKIRKAAEMAFKFTPVGAVINVTKNVNEKHKKGKDNKIPEFANGTENFSGGLAIVGERGPELVQLPAGTKIYNNNKTVSLIEKLSKPKFDKVLDFEKYRRIKDEKQTIIKETLIKQTAEAEKDNVIYLEIDLKLPDDCEAKVVNAKSSTGKNFKVRLKGKTKQ